MSAKTEYSNKTEVFSENHCKYMGNDANTLMHTHKCTYVCVYNAYYSISFYLISRLHSTFLFVLVRRV